MAELYHEIKQQNRALNANVIANSEKDSSDTQYTNYELAEIMNIQTVNWYLFVIFYAVAGIVCFLILTNEMWNIYVKVAISIVILIFPFIIYTIEYALYYLASYLYSLITFTPFNSVYLSTYQPKTYETIFNNRYYQLK